MIDINMLHSKKYHEAEKEITIYSQNVLDNIKRLLEKKKMTLTEQEQVEILNELYADKSMIFLTDEYIADAFSKAKMLSGCTKEADIVSYIIDIPYDPFLSEKEKISDMDKKLAIHSESVKGINYDGKNYELTTSIGTISFNAATDTYLKNNPELKKELAPSRRYVNGMGRCHELSQLGAKYIGGTAVTGLIRTCSTNIYHSFIEKEEQVIDISQNYVIDKDTYYKLNNVQVLNKIDSKELYSSPITINDFYILLYLALVKESLMQKPLQKRLK